MESLFAKGIVVDLRDPEFCEGTLTTEQGGVITGPDMRVQARRLRYTRKVVEGKPVMSVIAEGDLLLEFGHYIFLGDRLEFDFQTHTGVIYAGRTGVEPWFFGGEVVHLLEDGNYYVEGAFLTTSENVCQDWQIRASTALLREQQFLEASDVAFRIFKASLFWLPSFRVDLDSIFDSPIRYSLRWGGRRTRLGLKYEVFSWRGNKVFFILDYSLRRGIGSGFETHYVSEDEKESLETINYFGRLPSMVHPNDKVRYRMQGVYHNLLFDDSVSLDLTWDKLSDIDMPSDYADRALDIDYAMRTQLHMRKADPRWITNFFVRARVNSFQTVKQEFPTLQGTALPWDLGDTGLIADTQIKGSYLNFQYAKNQPHKHPNFQSARLEYLQRLYRPFALGWATWTPSIGVVSINYSESPQDEARWLAVGQFCSELNTRLVRTGETTKHVLVPYANYTFYTFPTENPNKHYIFDIDDGWYRVNMLRMGLAQNLYSKEEKGCLQRILFADIWANAFFGTPTLPVVIPKIHTQIVYNTTPRLQQSLWTGWDFQRGSLPYINYLIKWTLSEDFAISTEFRHRYSYEWRKVDRTNYILDSYRTSHALRHSVLSDRRNTLLVHAFYRLHPRWALEFEVRKGWERHHERPYLEWEVDLLGTVLSAWNIKLYYCQRVDGPSYGINFSIGIKRPSLGDTTPCFD